jgi:hypothetical protein
MAVQDELAYVPAAERVGLKRSQGELCDAWMRQSAVRSAQTAEGFKSEGIDLLGSHRDQISPEFAASLELVGPSPPLTIAETT